MDLDMELGLGIISMKRGAFGVLELMKNDLRYHGFYGFCGESKLNIVFIRI